MNARPMPVREIGLVTFIAAGLAALGIAMTIDVKHIPRPVVVEEIVLSDAAVVVPRFVSGAGLVDLNTASVEELTRLPGIGEALAARIVADRIKNGPYGSIDEIERVAGIGPVTVDGFRDRVTVEGAETP